MLKKISCFFVGVLIVINFCGCVFVAAGISDAEKVTQTLDVQYSQAVDAVRCAFRYSDVEFQKASPLDTAVVSVRGRYSDGRSVRIEISKVSPAQCKVGIRVGTSEAGKKDAQDLLRAIEQCAFDKTEDK